MAAPSTDETALRVVVENRQQARTVDAVALMTAARAVLLAEGVASCQLGIAVVDDAEMAELNERHLQHSGPTDVLSFSLDDESAPGWTTPDIAGDATGGSGDRHGRHLEGELVVSAETAHRVAAENGWSSTGELVLYVVHGTLHLCGYDDLSEPPRSLMRQRERELLIQLEWPELAASRSDNAIESN